MNRIETNPCTIPPNDSKRYIEMIITPETVIDLLESRKMEVQSNEIDPKALEH